MDTIIRSLAEPVAYEPGFEVREEHEMVTGTELVETSLAVDGGMAFSPWHGMAARRPIGSIMRVRKAAYEMSAKFRAEHNGQQIVEPRNLDDFSK